MELYDKILIEKLQYMEKAHALFLIYNLHAVDCLCLANVFLQHDIIFIVIFFFLFGVDHSAINGKCCV